MHCLSWYALYAINSCFALCASALTTSSFRSPWSRTSDSLRETCSISFLSSRSKEERVKSRRDSKSRGRMVPWREVLNWEWLSKKRYERVWISGASVSRTKDLVTYDTWSKHDLSRSSMYNPRLCWSALSKNVCVGFLFWTRTLLSHTTYFQLERCMWRRLGWS